MEQNLDNEFKAVAAEYRRKAWIEKEVNDLFLNFVLIGLFGGIGTALVVWRLLKKDETTR